MTRYEVIYDFCNSEYEYTDYNLSTIFTGTWEELQMFIESMKNNGAFNISAAALYDEEGEI